MPPTLFECAVQWRAVSEEMKVAMQEWRLQPPKATLQEMEAASDERLAGLRGRRLQDMARASRVADVSQPSSPERPVCPHCGVAVELRGVRERQVMTHQGKPLRLRCRYVRCPACQVGVFLPR
jgi:hypothetical protein